VIRILLIPAGGMEPVNKLDEAATPKRLLAGLNCWKTGQYDLIGTTGGVYMPPNIQTIPAARLMADWLTARSVPLEKILLADDSLDTFTDISSTLRVCADNGIIAPKFTIVTQWQHAIRFKITFWLAHGIQIKTKLLRYQLPWVYWLKEFGFIAYHLIDRHGNLFLARYNRKKRSQI